MPAAAPTPRPREKTLPEIRITSPKDPANFFSFAVEIAAPEGTHTVFANLIDRALHGFKDVSGAGALVVSGTEWSMTDDSREISCEIRCDLLTDFRTEGNAARQEITAAEARVLIESFAQKLVVIWDATLAGMTETQMRELEVAGQIVLPMDLPKVLDRSA